MKLLGHSLLSQGVKASTAYTLTTLTTLITLTTLTTLTAVTQLAKNFQSSITSICVWSDVILFDSIKHLQDTCYHVFRTIQLRVVNGSAIHSTNSQIRNAVSIPKSHNTYNLQVYKKNIKQIRNTG
ncbi:hypothetical protein [Winogradskyella psychrotolerans]|uniref:hypothetical protein n=1 Tax=Winogradskyella psychrotolerans TaxID=1344585 RepID=UPI001C0661F1|nr:hypothetical protein [Winogradskyella psychrotolerans]MBU2928298.1 hypothetical protein [Winogradskyella psychrotolerans]